MAEESHIRVLQAISVVLSLLLCIAAKGGSFTQFGDINADGITNFADYSIFANSWHVQSLSELISSDNNDVSNDERVDISHLAIFTENWLWPFGQLPPQDQWQQVKESVAKLRDNAELPFDAECRSLARTYSHLLDILEARFAQGLLQHDLQLMWGKHVVVVGPSSYIALSNAQGVLLSREHGFVGILDQAYEALADLTGLVPNNGDRIVVFWDPTDSGTYANHYIHLNGTETLDQTDFNEPWPEWGGWSTFFHEMGHVFTYTPNYWRDFWFPKIYNDGGTPLIEGLAKFARQYALYNIGMTTGFNEGVQVHAGELRRFRNSQDTAVGSNAFVGALLELSASTEDTESYSWDYYKSFFRLLEQQRMYVCFPQDVDPALQSAYFIHLMNEAFKSDLSAYLEDLGFRTTPQAIQDINELFQLFPGYSTAAWDIVEDFVGSYGQKTLRIKVPDEPYRVTCYAGDRWADTSIEVRDVNGNPLMSSVVLLGIPFVQTFSAVAKDGELVLSFSKATNVDELYPATNFHNLLVRWNRNFEPHSHWALCGLIMNGERTTLNLDMGTKGSPVVPGFTKVTELGADCEQPQISWDQQPLLSRHRSNWFNFGEPLYDSIPVPDPNM